MLIDALNLIETLTPTDGAFTVMGLSGPGGDLVIQGPSGNVIIQGNLTATVAGGGTGAFLLPVGTTLQRPSTGNPGQARFNNTTGLYEFGIGASWLNFTRLTGDTMTGPLVLSGDPTVALGAVTKQYADAISTVANAAVPKAGGTMTGLLVLSADPSAALGAVTKQYADAISTVANAALPKAGGTVTGATTFSAGGTALTVTNNVSFSGGTASNGMTLGSNTFSGVSQTINGSSGGTRWFRFQTAGTNRIQIGPSGTETGSGNAGADLVIGTFSDAGSNTGNSVTIYRDQAGIGQTLSKTFASNTSNNGPNSGLLLSQTFSGTNSVSLGAQLNPITINDNVNWTGSNNGLTGVNILHNYGGNATVGGRTAFWATLNQTAATSDLADNFYVGVTSSAIGNFNNGGTDSTFVGAKGRLFAENPTSHLKAGTNWYQVAGMEIDVQMNSGTSAAIRDGLVIANLGSPTDPGGTVVDAALWFYGPGSPWKDGILFGGGGQGWPINTTSGNLIRGGWNLTSGGLASQSQAKFGIDFQQVIFPSTGTPADGAAWRSAGASLDGVGTLQLGTTFFTSGSTGLAIDAKGAIGNTANGAGAIATAGSGYEPTSLVTDAYGGVYKLNTSGGVPTSITVVQQPVISSHSTPANPVATIPHPASTGSGLTLNLSWNTTASQLTFQAGGGAVQFGSGTFSANGSVATTLGSVGPTGSHTTVQEWFTVKNASGVTRYVPAF